MAVLTKEALFSGALLAHMTELEGGFLKKYCETMTQEGGESITFNRIKKSTARAGLTSMFDAGFAGTGGDMEQFKAMITQISAQDKIAEADMNKTKIDVKNGYIKSLGRAVVNKEDASIIEKVAAEATINKVALSGSLGDKANVIKLVAGIRKAMALSKYTPDNHKGVAVVMTSGQYADLATSDYVLNSDYANAFGGGMNGEPSTFYGAEIVIGDECLADGKKVYLIPSNTVCFGEWEGSLIADAVFVPTDARRYHVQAVKSLGVVVPEPTMITEFTVTP